MKFSYGPQRTMVFERRKKMLGTDDKRPPGVVAPTYYILDQIDSSIRVLSQDGVSLVLQQESP